MCYGCIRAFGESTPTLCRGTTHILKCSHVVEASTTECSTACLNPSWGTKRETEHACAICLTRSAVDELLELLGALDQMKDKAEKLRWEWRDMRSVISEAEIEAWEDKIAVMESRIRQRTPRKLWLTYELLGRQGMMRMEQERIERETSLIAERDKVNDRAWVERTQPKALEVYWAGMKAVAAMTEPSVDVRPPEPLSVCEFTAAARFRYIQDLANRTPDYGWKREVLEHLTGGSLCQAAALPMNLLHQLKSILNQYWVVELQEITGSPACTQQ
ncbi:hypothetical protein MMC19_003677 [Ptychographa xylographoides]|nr:hypothetical protein [Ptychographa xylographoides]